MKKTHQKQGFTLIELSLSIAFIAVLSLAVVLIISNAVSAYHRGLTLNQINTIGMELTADMRASIQNSPAASVSGQCRSTFNIDYYQDEATDASKDNIKACEQDGARNFVTVIRTGDVYLESNKSVVWAEDVPIFGALCTGNYSYIWNSGYFFNEDDYYMNGVTKAQFKYGKGTPYTDFRLLKVKDEARDVCISALGNQYTITPNSPLNKGTSYTFTSSSTTEEKPIDLLYESPSMVLYDLRSAAPAENTMHSNIFYSTSFILGTRQGGVNVKATGNFCKAPEDTKDADVENFDYCAINKFNFAAQATGG